MELYLDPVINNRNPINGQFLKGHKPHNKGKKWDDYMDMRKARKIKRIGKQNLRGRLDIGGKNKKQVIGIKDGKIIGVFESATKAAEILGLIRRNISHCCNGKRNRCGKIQWFLESENSKWFKYLT